MTQGSDGYAPDVNYLSDYIKQHEDFTSIDFLQFDLLQLNPLIDSSSAQPQHWNSLITSLLEHSDRYDGFVIIHGTDTLAYTASALSFVFRNLGKPIILTGSQVPLVTGKSDGHQNLLGSLTAASEVNPGCYIYFHAKLLAGNRSTKRSSIDFGAFETPNPPQGELPIFEEALPEFRQFHEQHVVAVTLFPGIQVKGIQALLQTQPAALIVRSYGSGNIPDDKKLLETLINAKAKGCILINQLQCQHGYIDMSQYAAAAPLRQIGALSAGDMTFEATLTKLNFLFSLGLDEQHVKQYFLRNLCGERSY